MNRSAKALTWTELRVGLLVIASLVVLGFTVLYVGGSGGSPFAARYDIRALMADVNGLKAGAPVRLGGVEVGAVRKVELASRGSGMVELTMRLEKKVQPRITALFKWHYAETAADASETPCIDNFAGNCSCN